MISKASISECGKYRFSLFREWHPDKDSLLWIMLNPSTADADVNDPTLDAITAFTDRAGYGSLWVVNLFPWRSSKPRELFNHPLSVIKGPKEEPDALIELMRNVGPKVVACAWGQNQLPDPDAPARIYETLCQYDCQIVCLGVNQDGSPKHPLYLPRNTKLRTFQPR